MRRRPSLRWLLVACAAVLLACTPTPLLVDSPSPPGLPFRGAFERLVQAQLMLNLPNSHTKTPERREADLEEAKRSIERLTARLASQCDVDEVALFVALSRADPDELESAQCAARVLAARGVPMDTLRPLFPAAVEPWADVLDGAALDGARLAHRERSVELVATPAPR